MIFRLILKEGKQLPRPVYKKLAINLRRVIESKTGTEEDAQAALRLVRFLSRKGSDQSVLFKHFQVSFTHHAL